MIFKDRHCYFSNNWWVKFIKKDNELYNTMLSVFNIYGLAIGFLSSKTIVINYEKVKNLTKNHILAIEAHELGHFIAGHKIIVNENDENDEIEADVIAINILLKSNLKIAAQFLIERLQGKNISYETYNLSKNVKNDIKNYIKNEV